MNALHFGAGNIGRGLLGLVLGESGYRVSFVDINTTILDALNTEKEYTIRFVGSDQQPVHIKDFEGLSSKTQTELILKRFETADLVTTSIGPNVLPFIAELVAQGLKHRVNVHPEKPLTVMACENMIGATTAFRGYINTYLHADEQALINQTVAFADTAIDCIVPIQTHDSLLDVDVEPYYEIVISEAGLKKESVRLRQAHYVADINPYIERKLFTVNTAHAAAAYLGYHQGFATIADVMAQEPLVHAVRSTLDETGRLLVHKYGFSPQIHQRYIETTLGRIRNPLLSDSVIRVGRTPLRKLGPQERLVRPAREYVEAFNEQPRALARVIATALSFAPEADAEAVQLQEKMHANSVSKVLEEVCGIAPYTRLAETIIQFHDHLDDQ